MDFTMYCVQCYFLLGLFVDAILTAAQLLYLSMIASKTSTLAIAFLQQSQQFLFKAKERVKEQQERFYRDWELKNQGKEEKV